MFIFSDPAAPQTQTYLNTDRPTIPAVGNSGRQTLVF